MQQAATYHITSPSSFSISALGLAGEAGEVADKIKKHLRDELGIGDAMREDIEKELGDVMWYVAACCTEWDLNLDQVMEKNLQKLQKRDTEGTLRGSGDDR